MGGFFAVFILFIIDLLRIDFQFIALHSLSYRCYEHPGYQNAILGLYSAFKIQINFKDDSLVIPAYDWFKKGLHTEACGSFSKENRRS